MFHYVAIAAAVAAMHESDLRRLRPGKVIVEPYRDPVRVVAPRLNCINCGAPHEPLLCSYCLTPHL